MDKKRKLVQSSPYKKKEVISNNIIDKGFKRRKGETVVKVLRQLEV